MPVPGPTGILSAAVRKDPCQREMSVLRLLINLHGPDRENPEAQVFRSQSPVLLLEWTVAGRSRGCSKFRNDTHQLVEIDHW